MRYQNSSEEKIQLVLEPWAEQYSIQPGQTVDILAKGGASGSCYEIEQTADYLIIYAWADCVASVSSNGVELAPDAQ